MLHSPSLTVFSIASSVVGVVVFVGLLVAGAGFLYQSFRKGKNQATFEEESRKERVDKTLKDLVDAQERRFQLLETDHKENLKQIGRLQGIIEEQSKQQKWFEGIFISALDKFFQENPALATELNLKLKREQNRTPIP